MKLEKPWDSLNHEYMDKFKYQSNRNWTVSVVTTEIFNADILKKVV